MNLKNNLFNYATSELSQDAFLCWLASYALEDAEPDDALRSCAREMLELFVPEFNGRPFTLTDVERQVWHIDALLASDLSRGLFSFRDKICPPHWITIAIRQLFPIGSHVQNVGQCLVGRALMRKGGRLDKICPYRSGAEGQIGGPNEKCKRRRPLSLAPAK